MIDVLMHLEITYNRSFPELEKEGGFCYVPESVLEELNTLSNFHFM